MLENQVNSIYLGIGWDHDAYNIIKYIEDNKNLCWTNPIFNNMLSIDDINFFLKLCDKENQKIINFIPEINENLEYWMTLDILWYSETLNAVPNYDTQLTIIPCNPLGCKNNYEINISLQNFIKIINR